MSWTVVLALDGLRRSEIALPYAQALRDRLDADLTVVSVVPVQSRPKFWLGWTRTADEDRASAEQLVDERRRYLDQIGADVNAPIRTMVCAGNPALHIADTLRRIDQPILVVARHEAGDSDHALAENSIISMSHEMSCPVLVVRPPATDRDWRSSPRFERVLVPVSGSRTSARLLGATVEVLGSQAPHLYLLWTMEWPKWASRSLNRGLIHDQLRALDAPALRQLEEMAHRLRLGGCDVSWIFGDSGRVVDQIRMVADRFDVDLIASTTAGDGGGSVYEARSLQNPRCPLLLFPATRFEQSLEPEPGRETPTHAASATRRGVLSASSRDREPTH